MLKGGGSMRNKTKNRVWSRELPQWGKDGILQCMIHNYHSYSPKIEVQILAHGECNFLHKWDRGVRASDGNMSKELRETEDEYANREFDRCVAILEHALITYDFDNEEWKE